MNDLEKLCMDSGISIKVFPDAAYMAYCLDEWFCEKVKDSLYILQHYNTRGNHSGKYTYHGQVKDQNKRNRNLTAEQVVSRIIDHKGKYIIK